MERKSAGRCPELLFPLVSQQVLRLQDASAVCSVTSRLYSPSCITVGAALASLGAFWDFRRLDSATHQPVSEQTLACSRRKPDFLETSTVSLCHHSAPRSPLRSASLPACPGIRLSIFYCSTHCRYIHFLFFFHY